MEMVPSHPSRSGNGDAQMTVPSAAMPEQPELLRSLQPGLGPTTFTALPAAMKFASSTLASPQVFFFLVQSSGAEPKVEVAVLGSSSLTICMISVDVKQH